MATAIDIMREEWEASIKSLMEEVNLDPSEKGVVSPGLKVMHKDSGIRYTVHSVSPRDVILRTPEGEKFIVSADTLENEYKLA